MPPAHMVQYAPGMIIFRHLSHLRLFVVQIYAILFIFSPFWGIFVHFRHFSQSAFSCLIAGGVTYHLLCVRMLVLSIKENRSFFIYVCEHLMSSKFKKWRVFRGQFLQNEKYFYV